MEIMGLAIIVILVSIGMLFTIKFVVLREPTEYKKEFTQTELASNMLSTLLKTSSGCEGLSFTELYKDCVKNRDSKDSQLDCGSGIGSCEYIQIKTDEILSSTLIRWGMGYKFIAMLHDETDPLTYDEDNAPGNDPEMVFGDGCEGVRKHKIFPVPIDASGRVLSITLDICDKEG